MENKNEEIQKLRDKQEKKKNKIENYKRKMKIHLFLFALMLVIYSVLGLEESYKKFGSITNFLTVTSSILLIFALIYYFVVKYLVRQREKEINTIRNKLYKLMKLDNE